MVIVGYVAMAAVGFVLGLIGGGGAILTMPILVYLFSMPPVQATGYSLFIVGSASVLGVWRYHKQGYVDYRAALIFVGPSLLGTYLARQALLPAIPVTLSLPLHMTVSKDQLVMAVFALVMIAASVSMIRPKKSDDGSGKKAPQADRLKLVFLGLMVGSVAGFVGAGGGFLIIPALVVLGGVSMRVAVPTSLFIIAVNSLGAFVGDLLNRAPTDWGFLLIASGVAGVGLFAGVRVAPLVSPGKLKVGFGWFVLLMGAWIFVRQII